MFCVCVLCVFVCVCMLARPGMLVLCVNTTMAASGEITYGTPKRVCLTQTLKNQLKVTCVLFHQLRARLFRLFSFAYFKISRIHAVLTHCISSLSSCMAREPCRMRRIGTARKEAVFVMERIL